MKRVKFLYNPVSGDGSMRRQLDTVFSIYQKYGYLVDGIRLDETLMDTDLFATHEDIYDHILIAGGDGTCDSIVNDMKQKGLDIPVAFLPMGTANDYANYLGMSSNVEESLRQILTLPPQKLDIGYAQGRYFLNVFSCGHFTDISQVTGTQLKNSIGIMAYFLKTFEKMRDFRPVPVKLSSKEGSYEGDMILCTVFNGVSVGGMRLALQSRANDGLLDVILLKNTGLNEFGPTILKLLRGDESALSDPSLVHFKTADLTIESAERVPTDLDGEKGPDLPVRIQCIPNGLTVLGVKSSL